MYRFIYKYYFASVKSIVSGFRSVILDPEDIFQEGLIAASLNVEKGRFNGESSFQTYLVAICRNICLKKLNRHQRMVTTDIENFDAIEEVYGAPEEEINRMLKAKALLDKRCSEIINLRFGLTDPTPDLRFGLTDPTPDNSGQNSGLYGRNMHFEEISSVLGIEPDNARQRFRRCMEKLRSLLVNDHSLKMSLTN